MPGNPYDERYAREGFYWGMAPSALCDRVLEALQPRSGDGLSLIDLGCGEGRNAIYFARHGFCATGLDTSLPGLEKARETASSPTPMG